MQNTKLEFINIMAALADNFNATVKSKTLDFWFKSFIVDGIEIVDIKKAARQILRTRTSNKSFKTMPNYADFIEIIEGTVSEKAEIQANLVIEKLTAGDYKYEFKDPITAHLLKKRWPFSDWGRTVLEKELEFWPRKFIEAYKAHKSNTSFIEISDNPKLKQLINKIG